jgi:hypothetical protein
MKVLIAITSCVRDAQNGTTQAQRETWLQDATKYPDITYKFFLGDGTPSGDDESRFRAMIKGAHDPNRGVNYEEKCRNSDADAVPPLYVPQDDEIILSCPDDYFHLPYKVRAMHRWALTQDFDYVYKADTDTYVDVDRLMSSGFEQHDFVGWKPGPNVAGGGG